MQWDIMQYGWDTMQWDIMHYGWDTMQWDTMQYGWDTMQWDTMQYEWDTTHRGSDGSESEAGGASIRVSPRTFKSSYLVDPASSHMLVSQIKPCMS